MQTFCRRVYVFDDCSTDGTPVILENHPLVDRVILNRNHDPNRGRAEWQNRLELLRLAQKHCGPSDWFVYQDADEFIEYDFQRLYSFLPNIVAVRMKLYDYYITNKDVDMPFHKRQYLGPEYRKIVMAFKNHPRLNYKSFDQREVHLNQPAGVVLNEGYVKHYGKAISVRAWEDKCRYYMTFAKYRQKWSKRRGQAIHTRSSFNLPLITWDQREEKGVLLTKKIELNSIY